MNQMTVVLTVFDILLRHLDSAEHLRNRPRRHARTMKYEGDFRLFIAVARQEVFHQRELAIVMLATAEAQLPGRNITEICLGLLNLRTTCVASTLYESFEETQIDVRQQLTESVFDSGPYVMIQPVYENIRDMLGGTLDQISEGLYAARFKHALFR